MFYSLTHIWFCLPLALLNMKSKKQCLTVVLICLSLIISEAEYPFHVDTLMFPHLHILASIFRLASTNQKLSASNILMKAFSEAWLSVVGRIHLLTLSFPEHIV